MRILIVVPPLTGHVNPMLAVSEQLAAMGHSVAWAGHQDFLRQHLSKAETVFDLPKIDTRYIEENSHKVRGLESITFFYQYFYLPLATQCLRPLEDIAIDYAPDLIVCDHQMLAGALVARRLNITWVSSITTSASMLQTEGALDDWLVDKLAEVQRGYASKSEQTIPRPDFSPHGCLVFSSEALVGGAHACIDAPYYFVGPSINKKRIPIEFPWSSLDPHRRKILVSLGTVSRDRSLRFYQVIIEALSGSDLQVVMVAPDNLGMDIPDNFIVRPSVPQLELLEHVDLVVSHAGHNTVCETLSHAIPMVLAPIRDDQPVVARQVVEAGAGLSVRFGKLTVKTAKETIFAVLDNPAYRERAQQIQRSFADLNGAEQAARFIDSLLISPREDVYACS